MTQRKRAEYSTRKMFEKDTNNDDGTHLAISVPRIPFRRTPPRSLLF